MLVKHVLVCSSSNRAVKLQKILEHKCDCVIRCGSEQLCNRDSGHMYLVIHRFFFPFFRLRDLSRDSGGSERSNSTRQLQQNPDLYSMGMPMNFCFFTRWLEFLITGTLIPPLKNRLVKCQGKCKLINNRGKTQLRFV